MIFCSHRTQRSSVSQTPNTCPRLGPKPASHHQGSRCRARKLNLPRGLQPTFEYLRGRLQRYAESDSLRRYVLHTNTLRPVITASHRPSHEQPTVVLRLPRAVEPLRPVPSHMQLHPLSIQLFLHNEFDVRCSEQFGDPIVRRGGGAIAELG